MACGVSAGSEVVGAEGVCVLAPAVLSGLALGLDPGLDPVLALVLGGLGLVRSRW